MPICQNCQKQWRWIDTIKRSFTLDLGMTCPYCNQRQYVSKSYRITGNMFLFLPIVAMFFSIWLDFSPSLAIIVAFILTLIVIGLYPFMIKLSNEEDPFWK